MNHRGHGGHREEGTISLPLGFLRSLWCNKTLRSLCSRWFNKIHLCPFLLLPLLLLLQLAPAALIAQSPELVQAKAQVRALNEQLEDLDETIAQELEAALAREVDTSPKGEFETTAEYQARLAAAEAARRQLEPEYELLKTDRRRAIQQQIEALTSIPYAAPVRISMGTYDADSQSFPFYARATGDSGTIEIPREVAPNIRTNLGLLQQTGYWRLLGDGTERLAVVGVEHRSGTYVGEIAFEVTLLRTLTGHRNIVISVAFSPDDQILATGSYDNTIKLWRTSDTQLLKTLDGHSDYVLSVAFSTDGQLLTSGSRDNTIKLWRTSDAQLIRTLEGHSSLVLSVVFAPDGQVPSTGLQQGSAERLGQVLASGSRDNTIMLWQVSDGTLLKTFKGHSGSVNSVAFSPDGKFLASASSDTSIKIWQVREPSAGGLLRTLRGHSGMVFSVSYSPNGQILASSGEDRNIMLWRVSDGEFLKIPSGHKSWVRSVVFSPDGQILATGSSDHTIKLWRVSDGKLLATLTGHKNEVLSVAFSPDGKILASGSADNTIKLWRISYLDDQFLAAIRSGLPPAGAPTLPPTLSTTVSFTEPSGNNVLDADEQAILAITLTNSGQGPAYGIEVGLSCRPEARPEQGRRALEGRQLTTLTFPAQRYIGEIPAGEQRQVSIPLKAGLELPDGRVALTCTFSEANGFEPDPVEVTFTTSAYRPPQLVVADVGIDDASGNGMIEAGEVVTVVARVQNRGPGAAEETQARVSLGQNVFTAAGSPTEFNLGTLPPGAYEDIQFQVYTNRRADAIPVSLTLTERYGRYGFTDSPLELPFNQPVRSIQQVVVEGQAGEVAEIAEAGGLSIDIERDIPQGRDERRDAVALIIANRRYQDPDVPDVTYAHRDGEFVKQYLVRTLGYREGNIFVYQDATLSNFRTALQRLANAARRGSEVFVYYTGHGAPDPEQRTGYFVPVDCDPDHVQVGGLALEEFYRQLAAIETGSVTVVIDACFSGGSAAGMLITEASPVFISVEDPAANLKDGIVLTSATGDQISSWYSEQNHSLYTYYFLKGLQGAADTNSDRTLTVGELQVYLEEQVPYTARRLYNRQQTPTVTPGSAERVLLRYE